MTSAGIAHERRRAAAARGLPGLSVSVCQHSAGAPDGQEGADACTGSGVLRAFHWSPSMGSDRSTCSFEGSRAHHDHYISRLAKARDPIAAPTIILAPF